MEYLISITTIPSRFDNSIHLCIDSLLAQSFKISRVIVNIPKKYSCRFDDEIPESKINDLKNKYANKNVVINLIDIDFGPGTKLLGLFSMWDSIYEDYIIVADDDHIYKSDMVEGFNNAVVENGIQAGGYCVSKLYDIQPHVQGSDGILIRTDLLNNFMSYYNAIKDEDLLQYEDDHYISNYLNLKGVEIHHIRREAGLIYESGPHAHTPGIALCTLKGKFKRSLIRREQYNFFQQNKESLKEIVNL
jgi:hypothetical protein